MAHQHYRSPFGDTTYTKVFVGGLAWETPTDVMRTYFQQFGEILEAVIINDKNTGKSKGYGFVTFRDPESARRACADPNPVIDGRRANCNIASLGRPRPSPPRGRNQPSTLYQSGVTALGGSPSPSHPSILPPPLPPPPPVIYPPYGYAAYPPDYGYHQAMYSSQFQQAQYYNPVYGGSPPTPSSSSGAMVAPPFYYGSYSLQAPRGSFSLSPGATATAQPQRFQGPSYLYYPPQVSPPPSSTYPPLPPPPPPPPILQLPRLPFPASTGDSSNINPPQTSTETEAGPTTSTSSTA
ncbi:uncharacterized protein LOC127248208 isoform X2 [Andrographis paniculata]|uniref:uncharacterized protein LOC127248208 isoform X2 n=1 Tax=Andrographis paniculata TaxID=175694 RepID=UPI0021E87BB6|nr:uncharacterized protein LOC127248208 isoform X2 [Andrographis paniculata]